MPEEDKCVEKCYLVHQHLIKQILLLCMYTKIRALVYNFLVQQEQ